MSRYRRPSENVEPPKSRIGSIVFLVGTVAAILILFPPWESKEERQERVTEKVLQKVEQVEDNSPRLVQRVREIDGVKLSLKVVTENLRGLDELLVGYYKDIDSSLAALDPDIEKSPIAEINRAAGDKPVQVPDRVYDLLKWCVQLAEATDGYFDPTMRPYYELWNFSRENPEIADPQVVESRVRLVGYKLLKFDDAKKTVFLPEEGMGIDLRMIKSGLVLGELKARLLNSKHTEFFAFYGSDATAMGKRFDGGEWKMSLQHPRKALHYYGLVTPGSRAVMVANDYETGFVRSGFRYHMYLDPYTGVPTQPTNTLAVAGPDPLMAEALAYAFFTMGPEKALEKVKEFPDYGLVVMDAANKVTASPVMQPLIKIEEGKSY